MGSLFRKNKKNKSRKKKKDKRKAKENNKNKNKKSFCLFLVNSIITLQINVLPVPTIGIVGDTIIDSLWLRICYTSW